MKDKSYYFNIFGMDIPTMDIIVATALKSGGDYCDLYFENTVYFNLMLKDGAVTSGGCHTDYGVGIRVLKGEKTGYAYSETTTLADILAAAKAASAIALGASSSLPYCSSADSHHDLYPDITPWRQADAGAVLNFLQALEKSVLSKDRRIVKVMARVSDSESDVMMYNSMHEARFDTRPMGSVTVTAVFQQGDRSETATASRSFRKGFEMLDPQLVEELAESVVKGIDARFEARRPKGGRMNLVMGAGASGILLHEAMGHAMEADLIRKGESIFAEKMGKRICPEGIDIVDDGTIAFNRGSGNYDDEGVAAQKTYMVRDGILTSYLHDRVSAAWFGVPSTGNGRRESFRYNPIPRMRATYMENGKCSAEDIILSVKKGIYVDEFSNGQVKIGEGDFTFFVKSGYLIENGHLTMPVKDVNIIGNGPEALSDIRAVGNDLKIDNGTWTCGKEQSVPVTCGIPTMLIGGLIVGGE